MKSQEKIKQAQIDWIEEQYRTSSPMTFEEKSTESYENRTITNCELPLPFVNDNQRAMPHIMMRTRLFGIQRVNKNDPVTEIVMRFGRWTLRYKGDKLEQNDLDVWAELVYRCQTSGEWNFNFTAGEFLKSIGKPEIPHYYDWLRESITRLTFGLVEISVEVNGQKFQMVHNMVHKSDSLNKTNYRISLDPEIGKLFAAKHFVRLDMDQRRKLGQSTLAKWIHGFYSTHKDPYPITIDTLMVQCGAEFSNKKSFKQKLSIALKRVSEVTGWKMSIKENKVYVNRKIGENNE